jgi:hypothetical protein
MSQRRDQPGSAQHPYRPLLVGVDDHGIVAFRAEKTHDTVVADRGPLHCAFIATDQKGHALRMDRGCDRYRSVGAWEWSANSK